MSIVKHIIHTIDKESIAYRYVPDKDQFNMGTIGLGGYSRSIHLFRRIGEDVFGKGKFRSPQMTAANKCWLQFRGTYTEYCDAIKKFEDSNMIVQSVKSFGNLTR
jgi:hypothetical protein